MYKDILVPVDLDNSHDWTHTLPKAMELAGLSGSGSDVGQTTLHVMTVVPDFGMSIVGQFFPAGFPSDVSTKMLEALKKKVATVVPDSIPHRHIIGEGNVYESIISMSERISADLIVIGSHRPELKDYLLGPNAARVVRHATCSVLVVRD